MKLKSTTNNLWKGWKLAWYHHFTHIACAKKLRGLRQKLDALRVQNGQSHSKYKGFGRKLICYKGISLFWTYLNSRLFVCSKCTIQSQRSSFQPFLTSFGLFRAFTHIFELNDHEIEKHYKWSLKRLKVGMVSSFHPHSMCKKVERVAEKLDALRVQNGQSVSKYQDFIRKLACYNRHFKWTTKRLRVGMVSS